MIYEQAQLLASASANESCISRLAKNHALQRVQSKGKIKRCILSWLVMTYVLTVHWNLCEYVCVNPFPLRYAGWKCRANSSCYQAYWTPVVLWLWCHKLLIVFFIFAFPGNVNCAVAWLQRKLCHRLSCSIAMFTHAHPNKHVQVWVWSTTQKQWWSLYCLLSPGLPSGSDAKQNWQFFPLNLLMCCFEERAFPPWSESAIDLWTCWHGSSRLWIEHDMSKDLCLHTCFDLLSLQLVGMKLKMTVMTNPLLTFRTWRMWLGQKKQLMYAYCRYTDWNQLEDEPVRPENAFGVTPPGQDAGSVSLPSESPALFIVLFCSFDSYLSQGQTFVTPLPADKGVENIVPWVQCIYKDLLGFGVKLDVETPPKTPPPKQDDSHMVHNMYFSKLCPLYINWLGKPSHTVPEEKWRSNSCCWKCKSLSCCYSLKQRGNIKRDTNWMRKMRSKKWLRLLLQFHQVCNWVF